MDGTTVVFRVDVNEIEDGNRIYALKSHVVGYLICPPLSVGDAVMVRDDEVPGLWHAVIENIDDQLLRLSVNWERFVPVVRFEKAGL